MILDFSAVLEKVSESAFILAIAGALSQTRELVAYLLFRNLKRGVRGYISGVHFQKCSKFNIIFSLSHIHIDIDTLSEAN